MRRRFDAGAALTRTFTVWFRGMPKFMLIAMVIAAPIAVVIGSLIAAIGGEDFFATMFTGTFSGPAEPPDGDVWTMLAVVVLAACGVVLYQFLTSGAIAYGVFRSLRGDAIRVGECLSVMRSRFLYILAVSLLTIIAYITVMLVPTLAIALIGAVAVGPLAVILLLIVVPFALGGVIWLACMFYVAVPATVVERADVFEAFGRSIKLTKGLRWWVVAIGAMVMGTGFGVTIIQGLLGLIHPVVDIVTSILVQLVMPSLGAVAQCVLYHDFRRVKEGLGDDDLAEIFA